MLRNFCNALKREGEAISAQPATCAFPDACFAAADEGVLAGQIDRNAQFLQSGPSSTGAHLRPAPCTPLQLHAYGNVRPTDHIPSEGRPRSETTVHGNMQTHAQKLAQLFGGQARCSCGVCDSRTYFDVAGVAMPDDSKLQRVRAQAAVSAYFHD
jgi:hypothetical protein